MDTTFQIRFKLEQMEQDYAQVLLDLRVVEQQWMDLVEQYHRARSVAMFDESFREWLAQYPSARQSSTLSQQCMDAWVDRHYDGLASRYYALQQRVLILRERAKRMEPLMDIVRQQAILAGVEAKIAMSGGGGA